MGIRVPCFPVFTIAHLSKKEKVRREGYCENDKKRWGTGTTKIHPYRLEITKLLKRAELHGSRHSPQPANRQCVSEIDRLPVTGM
jgi:hypothetical protein